MKLLKKEFLFFFFFLLFILFIIQNPKELLNIDSYINWSTIRALFVLLILTTAMKLSNFFEFFASYSMRLVNSQRGVALLFVTLSMFLSMLLTNDITLFIVVPITLCLKKIIKQDLSKLVIFEAIAVNAGSLLTPLGNPQNLFIFREWGIGFLEFVKTMSPVFFITSSTLLLFTWISFSGKKVQKCNTPVPKTDRFLFFSTSLFFILFVFALEAHFVKVLIPAILIWYAIMKKEVFLKVDYFLILTFILMFVDFNILSQIPQIKSILSSLNPTPQNIYNISVVLSQFMSNVPSAVFVSRFSNDFTAIAYGVNVAGNGFLFASLANIIALRFLNTSSAYVEFHKYSLPYFFITYTAVLFLM